MALKNEASVFRFNKNVAFVFYRPTWQYSSIHLLPSVGPAMKTTAPSFRSYLKANVFGVILFCSEEGNSPLYAFLQFRFHSITLSPTSYSIDLYNTTN